MKMFLFGWLLKGRCEVTLLDQFIGWGVGAAMVFGFYALIVSYPWKKP